MQLNCLLQQSGIEKIYILAQDYDCPLVGVNDNANEYIHPRIEYIYSEQCRPAPARNKLLKKFYESGDDWALFLDNDSIIGDRYDGPDIINIMERNMETLNKHADMILPISGRHHPFNSYIEKDKDNLKDFCPLIKMNYMKASLFFIKNIGIYFDEELTEQEDYAFVPRLLAQNKRIYMMQTVVLYEFAGTANSTMFESDRNAKVGKIREKIYNDYKEFGCGKGSDDFMKLSWKNMGDPHQVKKLWLPKVEEPAFGNGLFSL